MPERKEPPVDRERESQERLRADNERLREEIAFLRGVLDQAGDMVVVTDLSGRVTEWSAGAEKILGYAKEEALGRVAASFYVDPATRRRLVRKLRQRRDESLADEEVEVRRRDGRCLWLSLSLATLRDPSGKRRGTVGVAKDLTERRRLERELRRLSVTDKLTGLFNQADFFQKLEIEKERAVRLGHALVLVLLDLDGFKEHNDLRGHEAGDLVLRAVGAVIFQTIRKGVDQGFRYGGDEFCCLCPGSGVDGGLAFAERLRAGVEARGLGEITASVGLCAFDARDPAQRLLQAADLAMYRAKRAGGNRICVHGREGESWRRGVILKEQETQKIVRKQG